MERSTNILKIVKNSVNRKIFSDLVKNNEKNLCINEKIIIFIINTG